MMQVNDYGRGIFNGDQFVLNVALGDRPEPMAVPSVRSVRAPSIRFGRSWCVRTP